MEVKIFRDLIAWQKIMQLARKVYRATSQMPDNERFGLTAQMRRAALSIGSNIAEEHDRQSRPDYIHFLKTACGSLMELRPQLLLAQDLGFIRPPGVLGELLSEVDRVLQGLIRSLEKLQNQPDAER